MSFLISRTTRVFFTVGLLTGALSLAWSPQPVSATTCQIKCEKCTCNFQTGICDCTNCEISCPQAD